MHCANCGKLIGKDMRFCPDCGTAAARESAKPVPASRGAKIRLVAVSVLCALLVCALVVLIASPTLFKPFESLTIDELLDLGSKYLRDLDYEKAVLYFERAVQVDPRNPASYIGLALSCLGLNQNDKALEILREAAALFPDNREIAALLDSLLAGDSAADSGGQPDDGSNQPAGGIRGVPLEYIGKTVAELKAAFPGLQVQEYDFNGGNSPGGYIPNAAAVGLQQPGSDYAFFIYGTQYLGFETISVNDVNRLRCAGFNARVGVIFPDFAGLPMSDFFAAIGVTRWTFVDDNVVELGCIEFEYEGYIFSIDGSDIVRGLTNVMEPSFALTLEDLDILSDNLDILSAAGY